VLSIHKVYELVKLKHILYFKILKYDVDVELSKAFITNLIRYRTERGYTQKELAERSGISQRMIAHYETHVSNPPLDKINALADALNITVYQLLGAEEKVLPVSDFISSIDGRTMKHIKKIMQLTPEDRAVVYKMVDALLPE